jgi:hypothetical protein
LFGFQGFVAWVGHRVGRMRTVRLGIVDFGVKRSGWSGGMREARGDVEEGRHFLCFDLVLSLSVVSLLADLSLVRFLFLFFFFLLQLEATAQPPPSIASPPARSTPGEWVDTESVLSDCPDPYAEPEPEVPRNLRIDMNVSPPKTNTRTRSGRAFQIATAFMVEPGPKTYRAALKTPEAAEWTGAVNTEIAALDSHQAMEFIAEGLPPGATVVNSRWLLSKKFKATGEIDKYKARLIAQGYTQKEGQDFDGNTISSPVVDASTIRLCLGLAAQRNLQIAILDCPTAFLGSTLHETIFLRLPEGNWQDPWKRERPLVRLRKTLYGLKQSARGWFEDVYDFLVDHLALRASVAAPGLFLGDGIIVLVYVDDIMILTTTVDKLTSVCNALHHRFRAAPPKGASIPISDHFQYVGLDIQLDREHRTAYINQCGYISKVLEQFGMSNCRPRYTPMEEGLKLGPSEAGDRHVSLVYDSHVMSRHVTSCDSHGKVLTVTTF